MLIRHCHTFNRFIIRQPPQIFLRSVSRHLLFYQLRKRFTKYFTQLIPQYFRDICHPLKRNAFMQPPKNLRGTKCRLIPLSKPLLPVLHTERQGIYCCVFVTHTTSRYIIISHNSGTANAYAPPMFPVHRLSCVTCAWQPAHCRGNAQQVRLSSALPAG